MVRASQCWGSNLTYSHWSSTSSPGPPETIPCVTIVRLPQLKFLSGRCSPSDSLVSPKLISLVSGKSSPWCAFVICNNPMCSLPAKSTSQKITTQIRMKQRKKLIRNEKVSHGSFLQNWKSPIHRIIDLCQTFPSFCKNNGIQIFFAFHRAAKTC